MRKEGAARTIAVPQRPEAFSAKGRRFSLRECDGRRAESAWDASGQQGEA
jgi:hypothetical protein